MADADLYLIAGIDMRPFVTDWLANLESGGGEMRGLLEHALHDPQLSARYSYGADYMSANIAPRATPPDSTPEELLLFAVMAVYHDADCPGADPKAWDGEAAHLHRALEYFHEIGDREAARRLRAAVIRRSLRERPTELDWLLNRSLNNDPARIAAHEREMASIDLRSFRAAELLDPDGDFDAELTALQEPDVGN